MSHTDLQCSAQGQSAFGWDFCHGQGDSRTLPPLPFLGAQITQGGCSMPGAPQKSCNFFVKTATVKISIWQTAVWYLLRFQGALRTSLVSVPCVLSVLCPPPHLCHCRGVTSGTDLAQVPLARPALHLMLCRDLKIRRGQSCREGLHRLFCVLWPHTAVLCLSSPQGPTPPFQGLSSPFAAAAQGPWRARAG